MTSEEYTDLLQKEWRIQIPDQTKCVRINFVEMDTELDHDLVTIYDGSASPRHVVGVVSGPLPSPTDYFSSGPEMTVTFSTNSANTADGFTATWESIRCGTPQLSKI